MRQELVTKLRELGVTKIYCAYSGYGDSGSLDTVQATPAMDLDMVFDQKPNFWDNNKLNDRSVGEAIHDLFYDLLEQNHPGWEINDGSDGEFTWDITTDRIAIDHGEHYTETHRTSHEL